jgi:hypothetical protein
MYWKVIRAANGAVNERRFSGSDDPMSDEQIIWHYYNILLDDGIDIDAESVSAYSDFQIYELSKHIPLEQLVKRFQNTTIEDLKKRIDNYLITRVALDSTTTNKVSTEQRIKDLLLGKTVTGKPKEFG